MHVWRVLCLCCLALLGGCLVSFEQGIPPEEAAPMPLLGDWQRQNEWGESQYLSISHAGAQRYRARLADDDDKFEEYPFTVAAKASAGTSASACPTPGRALCHGWCSN